MPISMFIQLPDFILLKQKKVPLIFFIQACFANFNLDVRRTRTMQVLNLHVEKYASNFKLFLL